MNPDLTAFKSTPFAHRAYHDALQGRIENSRAAVSAAVEAGYGIEIDIQLSADHQAMVFHDYSLDRLTAEKGPIRRRNSKELSEIKLNGCNEGIPNLPEILKLVSGRVPLLIELKDQDGALGSDVGPLENAVAIALQQYDGPVAVMSYNPHSVALLKSLAPSIPRGLTTGAFLKENWLLLPELTRRKSRKIPDYERVGASFISHSYTDLERPRVADLKKKGALIICWTIKSAQAEQESRKIADNITFEGYRAAIPIA